MKKTAVVYWSGTGNTEAMAKAVAEGMESAGAQVTMLTPDQVKASELSAYDAIAFGCPAMGSEVLEEMEFQPMFDEVKRSLGGKSAALFGSYGWGDGQWMRDWVQLTNDANAVIYTDEGLIINETPDDDGMWMRGWEKDCDDSGIRLVCESVTCCEAPDDAALDACRALGKELAK